MKTQIWIAVEEMLVASLPRGCLEASLYQILRALPFSENAHFTAYSRDSHDDLLNDPNRLKAKGNNYKVLLTIISAGPQAQLRDTDSEEINRNAGNSAGRRYPAPRPLLSRLGHSPSASSSSSPPTSGTLRQPQGLRRSPSTASPHGPTRSASTHLREIKPLNLAAYKEQLQSRLSSTRFGQRSWRTSASSRTLLSKPRSRGNVARPLLLPARPLARSVVRPARRATPITPR